MTIYGRSEELVSRCVECDLAEPESLASLGGSAPGFVDGILSSLLYAPAPKDAPFLDPRDLLSESVVVCSSLMSSLTVLLLLESVMALSSSAVPAAPILHSW